MQHLNFVTRVEQFSPKAAGFFLFFIDTQQEDVASSSVDMSRRLDDVGVYLNTKMN